MTSRLRQTRVGERSDMTTHEKVSSRVHTNTYSLVFRRWVVMINAPAVGKLSLYLPAFVYVATKMSFCLAESRGNVSIISCVVPGNQGIPWISGILGSSFLSSVIYHKCINNCKLILTELFNNGRTLLSQGSNGRMAGSGSPSLRFHAIDKNRWNVPCGELLFSLTRTRSFTMKERWWRLLFPKTTCTY